MRTNNCLYYQTLKHKNPPIEKWLKCVKKSDYFNFGMFTKIDLSEINISLKKFIDKCEENESILCAKNQYIFD